MYEEKVAMANVYDPVKYMLKNLKRRTVGMVDEKIKEANKKEGGVLLRNGHVLMKVEGNQYYDYFLYYNDRGLLRFFYIVGKESGSVEQWTLHYADNRYLLRYEYHQLSEGGLEEEVENEEVLYPGAGESIDPYL